VDVAYLKVRKAF